MTTRNLLALCAAATLTACGEADLPAPEPTPEQAAFDPGQLRLQEISYDEFSEIIAPGRGCSFETASGELIFVATVSDDDGTEAVVNTGDGPHVLSAAEGGYDNLLEGGEFEDEGHLTITITRDGGEGTAGEIETTSWPARLVLQGDNDASRAYDAGTYSCGA